MNSKLEVTIVVENSVHRKGLLAEHGLSFWIKYKGEEYLFDTGQGKVLLKNIEALDLDLDNLAGVILSHGHYDHGSGLEKLLELRPELKVYTHPLAFNKKYSKYDQGLVERGIDLKEDKIDNLIVNHRVKEISSGLFLTGEVPQKNEFETISDRYKVLANSKIVTDQFKDDQALFIETEKGIVVLLGCSHRGVVNIIEYIKEVTAKKIYAVIGGMHLINASKKKIDKTVDYLSKLDLDFLVPLHCTGFKAVYEMKKSLEDRVEIGEVGDKFRF